MANELSARILYAITPTISKTENISNDDEIEVSFEIDENKLSDIGYKIKLDNLKIKVESLENPQVINYFENYSIQYLGYSPYIMYRPKNNWTNTVITSYITPKIIAPEQTF